MRLQVKWDELHVGDVILSCDDTVWGKSDFGDHVVHGVRDGTATRFELSAKWGQYGLSWAEYSKQYTFTVERSDWPDVLAANLRDAGYAQLAFRLGCMFGYEDAFLKSHQQGEQWEPGCGWSAL